MNRTFNNFYVVISKTSRIKIEMGCGLEENGYGGVEEGDGVGLVGGLVVGLGV